jgi:phytoene dehydrogenase-like protein
MKTDGATERDVVVVGAGLAGLTAAVSLARAGRSVTVYERLPRAGGLCGTFVDEGYEFVLGCNEFGSAIVGIFAALGLDVEFRPSRTRVSLGDETLSLPPNARTVLRLARRGPVLFRFLWRAWRTQTGSLAEVLDAAHAPTYLCDLIGVIAALAGVPLQSMRLEEVREVMSTHRGFGWSRPVKPVGGPPAMVAALERGLERASGRLCLGVEVHEVRRDDGGAFRVRTGEGEVTARQVVSSRPRWDCYPSDAEPGLALAQLALVVRGDLVFPKGFQTLYHVPRDVRGWMNELAAGRAPRAFAFNLAQGLLPERPGYYTLVGFFAVPRGESEWSARRRASLERYILEEAERMLPGLGAALLFYRLYSPAEYLARHGISSQPVPLLPRNAFVRPSQLDHKTGILHAGTSVFPPGNDANAAVVSGLRASELAQQALATDPACAGASPLSASRAPERGRATAVSTSTDCACPPSTAPRS